MSKYKRSRIELHIDVLRAIKNGRKSPTRIVYAANLSYDRVIRCISFLEEQNLVHKIADKKKIYEVTEKGLEVLKYFDEIEDSLFDTKKKASLNTHSQYVHELPSIV